MEEVVQIDGGGFGLLTRAQGDASGDVVVLFNPGLIHRCGPQRFHVELARRLSQSGYHVFRFDLPGIGDAAMDGSLTSRELAACVFDQLESQLQARGFIVGGICSAADLGWRMAVSDPRVRGLLLIDPLAVRGLWYTIGRLRMAMRRPLREWPTKLLRALKRGAVPGTEEPTLVTEDYRDWPSLAEFDNQGRALLARGVRILALYTGGVSNYLLHRGQVERTFKGMGRHHHLRVEFQPQLDHVLYAARDRRHVVALVEGWLAPNAAG